MELSLSQLVEDEIARESTCSLVALYLSTVTESQLLLEEYTFLLQLPLTEAAFINIVSQCTATLNGVTTEEDASDTTDSLLDNLSPDEQYINVTRVLWLDNPTLPARRLLARRRGATASPNGQVISILRSADVSSQEWTVNDLPVQGDVHQGAVLKPRVLGRGNEVLGGLELSQTRVLNLLQRCQSRFYGLVAACGSFGSHASNTELTDSYHGRRAKSLLPFGRDPAFNRLSGLFSATAQIAGEGSYYNMSTGSTDVTAHGFPAAFFPRSAKGKKKFLIVFPVR